MNVRCRCRPSRPARWAVAAFRTAGAAPSPAENVAAQGFPEFRCPGC
ncbi:hypothetical protein I549_2754 [Mycobacterium avium subsp. avium 2285 (R)]|nr:hypothetical protein I549_2754 [Mycobacterium avium subsp. avium 2285 (R)]